MRKLQYVLLAMMLAPLFIVSNGCGDEPVEPKDSIPVVTDTAGAGMKVGFDKYALVLDDNQTDGHYRAADNKSIIYIVGFSKKADGGVVDGKGEIELQFPGKAIGNFTQAVDDIVIEVATGEPPTRTEYSYDANSNMVINITEYGAIGDKIKGTFSGKLKSGINSRDVRDGFFRVTRSADQ